MPYPLCVNEESGEQCGYVFRAAFRASSFVCFVSQVCGHVPLFVLFLSSAGVFVCSFCFPTELLGSCIAVFVLAALYEGLKVLRETLMTKSLDLQRRHVTPTSTSALFTDSKGGSSVR